MDTQKCRICGKVQILQEDFYLATDYSSGYENKCKKCTIKIRQKRRKDPEIKEKDRVQGVRERSTEHGFLRRLSNSMRYRFAKTGKLQHKCFITLQELKKAFSRHKAQWGMHSAWGPYHLEITMIVTKNKTKVGTVKTRSNLSVDRLDPRKPYTIQNIIFIRVDENNRKKDSTYEDCCTQKQLHEERFIKMKAI